MILLLAYLYVDASLDLEALGTFFTASLLALSTNGLTEVDTDPLHGVWKSIHKVTAIGTLLCRLLAYSKFIFTFICNWQIFLSLIAITLKSINSVFVVSRFITRLFLFRGLFET